MSNDKEIEIEPEINVPWESNCAGEIFLKTDGEDEGLRIGHFQGDANLAAYMVNLHHEALAAAESFDESIAPWLDEAEKPKPVSRYVNWLLAMKNLVTTLENWQSENAKLKKKNEALMKKLKKRDELLIQLSPWIEKANENADYSIPGIIELRKITGVGSTNPADLPVNIED